ncbi:hypothetical protein E4U38_002769 [Claviceps purpurea]|nr:hypothetical protein E4U38_002769 [Claviceps purpurea]
MPQLSSKLVQPPKVARETLPPLLRARHLQKEYTANAMGISLMSSSTLEVKAQHVLNAIRSRTEFTARRSSSCMVTPKRSHKASVLSKICKNCTTDLKDTVETNEKRFGNWRRRIKPFKTQAV